MDQNVNLKMLSEPWLKEKLELKVSLDQTCYCKEKGIATKKINKAADSWFTAGLEETCVSCVFWSMS